MIEEAFVSFENAKLLKEKGFHNPTRNFYSDGEIVACDEIDWNNSSFGHISAPTQQMVMRWLREVHNLHVDVDPSEGVWDPTVLELESWSSVADIPIQESYEESCEAAIKYCLENLI